MTTRLIDGKLLCQTKKPVQESSMTPPSSTPCREGNEAVTSCYSSDGPICPHCAREYTPDEPAWYQDHTMDCDDCGKSFRIEVETHASWTTRAAGAA